MTSNTIAAEIGYNKVTQSDIFTSGEVDLLIVRLGYKDHPLDDSNPYYCDDASVKKVIEGAGGGPVVKGKAWEGGISGFYSTSSYGKMSLKVRDIIDIQMSGNKEDYISSDDDEMLVIYRDVISSEEYNTLFHQKLQEKGYLESYDEETDKMTLNTFDEDGNGMIDAMIMMPCEYHTMGSSAEWWAFSNVGINGHTYIPFGSYSEDANFGFLTHELGHLLLGLDDYYVLSGFSDMVTPNVMSSGLGDLDAYSKYLVGWLNDENTVNVDITETDNGVISLTPSDSDTDDGKKLALFDYYGLNTVVAEYIEGINNNASGKYPDPKKGFRFYLTDKNGKMKESYLSFDIDSPIEEWSQVAGEGEEINNLFDLGMDIKNIKTGDNASFEFSINNDDLYYDESEIVRIDLRGKEKASGKVDLIEYDSGQSGSKIVLVQTDSRTYLCMVVDEGNYIHLNGEVDRRKYLLCHELDHSGNMKICKNIFYNHFYEYNTINGKIDTKCPVISIEKDENSNSKPVNNMDDYYLTSEPLLWHVNYSAKDAYIGLYDYSDGLYLKNLNETDNGISFSYNFPFEETENEEPEDPEKPVDPDTPEKPTDPYDPEEPATVPVDQDDPSDVPNEKVEVQPLSDNGNSESGRQVSVIKGGAVSRENKTTKGSGSQSEKVEKVPLTGIRDTGKRETAMMFAAIASGGAVLAALRKKKAKKRGR